MKAKTGRSVGALAATAVCAALALSACGSDSESESSSSSGGGATSESSTAAAEQETGVTTTWKGTGSLKGNGETIAVFLPSGGLQFNALWQKAAEEVATAQGYKVRFFTNQYDQAEQDRQVQQFIATGQKPIGSILYPPVPLAAKNSMRQLARLGPVVQGTTGPAIDPAPFAGGGHDQTGRLEADAYEQLQQKLKEEGKELKGNVLFYNGPEGLQAGVERRDGFLAGLKEKGITINKVGEELGMVDRQTGYKLANQSLSKYKDKFDVIWALNLSGAQGIVQALKEQGYKPGEDVFIVSGGDCTGGADAIADGDVFSTVAQSPTIEGRTVMRSMVQLIASGGYKEGTVETEPTPTEPPIPNEPPAHNTLAPALPIVGPEGVEAVNIWGEDVSQICPK